MFIYPRNSSVEILTPTVGVLGTQAFEKWLSHEGGALTDGISALLEETPALLLCEDTVGGQGVSREACSH